MKVMIVSSNRSRFPYPVFPSGPAYVAGAALKAGHQVEVFDCYFTDDVPSELEESVKRCNPDVIGISIRNVFTGQMFNHRDFRTEVKAITDCVKQASNAPIVLGGSGFNLFGREWLDYLQLDYGIRGEGELTFPLYLKLQQEGGDIRGIPGCVYRENSRIHEVSREFISDLDDTAFPACELFDLEQYQRLGTYPTVFTQRGCSIGCSYCPRSSLEGTRHRMKSAKRVVDELSRIKETGGIDMFYFADNTFNFPRNHAESICKELVKRKMNIHWFTDTMLPLRISDDFCHLIKEAGCTMAFLAVESGSAKMLKNMNRGLYGPEDIREAVINLNKAQLPFGIGLLLGGPGETEETISETLNLIDNLPKAQLTHVTIGLGLEPQVSILQDAKRDGQIRDESGLFEGAHYLSPFLSEEYVKELMDSLITKPNWLVF